MRETAAARGQASYLPLLPLRKHRFMIYKFGEPSALSPIKESEEFGDSHGDN